MDRCERCKEKETCYELRGVILCADCRSFVEGESEKE